MWPLTSWWNYVLFSLQYDIFSGTHKQQCSFYLDLLTFVVFCKILVTKNFLYFYIHFGGIINNLRSGSIFVSLGETLRLDGRKRKIEPDTILLRNVYCPLFWLTDIQQNSQSKFLLLAWSSVCKFPITAIRKKSRKCQQNKKIIGYNISSGHKHSNLHDC